MVNYLSTNYRRYAFLKDLTEFFCVRQWHNNCAIETEGLDTKTWLNSNNLGHLYQKFLDAEFTIEDLITCDEEAVKYAHV